MFPISDQDHLIIRELPADTETPVSIKLKLGKRDGSFLFESIQGGTQLSRYSFIGFDPLATLEIKDGVARVGGAMGGPAEATNTEDPIEALRQFTRAAQAISPDVYAGQLPPMASGAFGYIGYDMIQHVEPVTLNAPDILGVPEAFLVVPSVVIIFDHLYQKMLIIARVIDGASEAEAEKRLDEVVGCFHKATPQTKPVPQTPIAFESNLTQAQYHQNVEAAQDFIKAGDIFQVVPSQRFSAPYTAPPLNLYRALRQLNPSAFMFVMELGDVSLVGSSPEIMVRVRDGRVAIRPIAGTRPRTGDKAVDAQSEADLMADPKEQAEHLMLLDLGRNDVGRVAAWDSVEVTESFKVEHYSHVMHIISQVEGDLRDGLDNVDALFAGFPAGTVSGAPKIRAMQIIDILEPERRGIYGGAIGYFGWNGDLDTCIALRTAIIKNETLYIQAGGGVVLDSDVELEYQETLHKANALRRAADLSANFREAL